MPERLNIVGLVAAILVFLIQKYYIDESLYYSYFSAVAFMMIWFGVSGVIHLVFGSKLINKECTKLYENEEITKTQAVDVYWNLIQKLLITVAIVYACLIGGSYLLLIGYSASHFYVGYMILGIILLIIGIILDPTSD